MFGQFIIMRKSKFENIARVAGVCQKLLPTFRCCLKNEKGVEIGIGLVFLGVWPAHYRSNVSVVSGLSSIIGLQNNSNPVDCKVLIKPAMHNLLPRSLNAKLKIPPTTFAFRTKFPGPIWG